MTVKTGSEGIPGFDFDKLENLEDSAPCFVLGSGDIVDSPRRLKTLPTFASYKDKGTLKEIFFRRSIQNASFRKI